MDTTSIRNFAVEARERLIAGVDERLNMLGFDAEGNIPEEIFYEIRDMSVAFGLPISYDSLRVDEILETMKKDKKRIGETTRMILLKRLGSSYIDETVTDDEIRSALQFLRYEG